MAAFVPLHIASEDTVSEYARRWLVQATILVARQADLAEPMAWTAASITSRYWDTSPPLLVSPWAVAAAGVSLRLKLAGLDDDSPIPIALAATEKAQHIDSVNASDTAANLAPVGEAVTSNSPETITELDIGAAEVDIVARLRFDIARQAPHQLINLAAGSAVPALSLTEKRVSLQLLNALTAGWDGAFDCPPWAVAVAVVYMSRAASGGPASGLLGQLAAVKGQPPVDPDLIQSAAAAVAGCAREVVDPHRALRCLVRTAAAMSCLARLRAGATACLAAHAAPAPSLPASASSSSASSSSSSSSSASPAVGERAAAVAHTKRFRVPR